MIFKQLFDGESFTYTYLLVDERSREAVLIDPVYEQIERDLQLLEELEVSLKYILETHVHADHITAAHELRAKTGAKIAYSARSGVSGNDIMLNDGDELQVGTIKIRAIHTPGHTQSCVTYYTEGMLFTGDTIFVRGSGRTDFQDGSSEDLFHSVREKIFSFPDETSIYPGHDYHGHTSTSVGEEKRLNPRLNLNRSKLEFLQIMKDLKLAKPKKIHIAVPANLNCGKPSRKEGA